jgi:tetratricopeptide (TPR) repeat protein
MHLEILGSIALGIAVAAAPAADDLAPVKEAAVRLYDQGAYEEARSSLEQLDAARVLDGPMLYRLYFCEKAAGRADDARKVLDRAKDMLESEVTKSSPLETSFYLANAYANLGRAQDAREAAHAMTARIESGKAPAPATAIGRFQLGKLYQDQGRQREAEASYAKAVEGFDLKDGRYVGNLRWALRYIGNGAFARAEYGAAESAFAKLGAAGGAETADWDALAAARVRLGNYDQASAAWKEAVKLDPANADDPRYAARLADGAALVAPLPAKSADGRAFSAMSQKDLEDVLKSQADAVMAAQSRVTAAMLLDDAGNPKQAIDPKLRVELTQTLKSLRQQFAAAGLEYALKHYGIRETAFRGGYAALVFQERSWEVPPDPEPAAGGDMGGS